MARRIRAMMAALMLFSVAPQATAQDLPIFDPWGWLIWLPSQEYHFALPPTPTANCTHRELAQAKKFYQTYHRAYADGIIARIELWNAYMFYTEVRHCSRTITAQQYCQEQKRSLEHIETIFMHSDQALGLYDDDWMPPIRHIQNNIALATRCAST